MYIDANYYNVDISDINRLRYALYSGIYSDQFYINSLQSIIERNIKSKDIYYDDLQHTFVVSMSKSATKKFGRSVFAVDPRNTYGVISKILYEFLTDYRDAVILSLQRINLETDSYQLLNMIMQNSESLSGLAHISYTADNELCIQL